MKAPAPALLAALALAPLATAGCGEDFAPYNRLTDELRVLALRTSPVAPSTGETTTMDALVWNPVTTAPTVTYHWRWCPVVGQANDGYPCPTQEQVNAFLPGAPSIELGNAPTATFTNSLDPALLAQLCAGSPIPCDDGIQTRIRLTVSNGVQTIEAIRTLRLRFRADQPANENPTVGGLVAALPGGDAALDDAGSVVIPRKVDTLLRVDVPLTSAESYLLPGAAMPKRERLIVTWYVQTGDTRIERTSFIEGQDAYLKPFENKWKPAAPSDYPPSQARVIVVVNDDRGGFAWTGATVTLGAAP